MTCLEKFDKMNISLRVFNLGRISGVSGPFPKIYNFLYLIRIIRQFKKN